MINFVHNDGGRSTYFSGKNAGDCVVRAIAIATGLDYKIVYDAIAFRNKCAWGKKSARNGVHKSIYELYLKELGFVLTPAPKFDGRKAKPSDMPMGMVIANQAKHLSCVIDGIPHDIFDSSQKMVYNYWIKK
jgi:hypothetical protein